MLDRLDAILRDLKRELTGLELAEVLWLALQLQQLDPPGARIHRDDDQTELSDDPSILTQDKDQDLDKSQSDAKTSHAEPAASADGNLFQQQSEEYTPGESQLFGRRFRSPGAPALPRALDIGRALRPLRRKIPSRVQYVLDEPETAQQIAEGGVYLPVLRPAPTRWMDVALVVDIGASMQIWRQTILELLRLLEREGAFRDIRMWSLSTDSAVQLRSGFGSATHQGLARDPKAVLGPPGRRLILLVTDCVSQAWHTGAINEVLPTWAERHPLVLVQVLPQRYWDRSALEHATQVRLRSLRPGVPNSMLRGELLRRSSGHELPPGIALPVATLEPTPLGACARLIAGRGNTWMTGVVLAPVAATPDDEARQAILPARTSSQDMSSGDSGEGDESLVGVERFQQFRATASIMARRLAGFLAAAPCYVSLPLIRLIQHVMLPTSEQIHVAEVFLAGLLHQLTPNVPGLDPDLVQYDFLPGVRIELLNGVPRTEALQVFNRVTAFVNENIGQANDFFTVLSDAGATHGIAIPADSRAFANVQVQILRRFGDEYARQADEIERKAGAGSKQDITEPLMPSTISNDDGAVSSANVQSGDGEADPEGPRESIPTSIEANSPITEASEDIASPRGLPSMLVNDLQRRALVLFVGADLPREISGVPSRFDLARELARRHGLDETLPLTEVAQQVGQDGNRWTFTAFIRDSLDAAAPQPFHQHLVALVQRHEIETIVTAAYDNLLELAFRQANLDLSTVVRGSDVAFVRPNRPTLFKLYGDLQQPHTLVVTDRDHSDLLHDRDKEPLLDEVRQAFRRNKVLFLGYKLADPDMRFIFDQVTESRFARTAYAVWPSLPPPDAQMWRDRGITILDANPLDVLEGMAAQDTFQYDAFISYSEPDSDWVETVLVPGLESAGLRLCIPKRDFVLGVSRITNTENAIARSRKTILVLTPNWIETVWSQYGDVLMSPDNPIGERRRIIPVLLQPCILPRRLKIFTLLDLTKVGREDTQMRRLITALLAASENEDEPKPSSRAHSAQDSFKYDAFISYSEPDSDWVETVLVPQLESAGLRLCIPNRDFELGVHTLTNTENAILRSRKKILVLTPSWVASEWSQFDVVLMRGDDPIGGRGHIIPILVQPCELPVYLRVLTLLDLTDPARFHAQMQRLIASIVAALEDEGQAKPFTRAHTAQDTFRYDTFISYSQQDSDWVETVLVPRLESAGLRLCIPNRDFELGVSTLTNTENAILRSRKTILVLTPNWVASEWSQYDSLIALSNDPTGRQLRLIPLLIKPCTLPRRLQYYAFLDLTDPGQFDARMRRLITELLAPSEDENQTDSAAEPG